MQELKVEGVGVPVAVSGTVETPSATLDSPEDKLEALRRVSVFADLPQDQLEWFAENAKDLRLAAGDTLFRKGDPPEGMAVYPQSEIHPYRDDPAPNPFLYIPRPRPP